MPKKDSYKKPRRKSLKKKVSYKKSIRKSLKKKNYESYDGLRTLDTKKCYSYINMEDEEFGDQVIFHYNGQYICSGVDRQEFTDKINITRTTRDGINYTGYTDSTGYVFFPEFVGDQVWVKYNDVIDRLENTMDNVFYLTRTNEKHSFDNYSNRAPNPVCSIEAESRLLCRIVENTITHNISKGEVIRQLEINYGMTGLRNKTLPQLCNLLQSKVTEDIQEAIRTRQQQQVPQEDEELTEAIEMSLQQPNVESSLARRTRMTGNKTFLKSLIDVSQKCFEGIMDACSTMLSDPTVKEIISGTKNILEGSKKVLSGTVKGITKASKWSGKKAATATRWSLQKTSNFAGALAEILKKYE